MITRTLTMPGLKIKKTTWITGFPRVCFFKFNNYMSFLCYNLTRCISGGSVFFSSDKRFREVSSLICLERSEGIAHLIWAKWENERMSEFPALPYASVTMTICFCYYDHMPLLLWPYLSVSTTICLCYYDHMPLFLWPYASVTMTICLCYYDHMPLLLRPYASVTTTKCLCYYDHMPLLL